MIQAVGLLLFFLEAACLADVKPLTTEHLDIDWLRDASLESSSVMHAWLDEVLFSLRILPLVTLLGHAGTFLLMAEGRPGELSQVPLQEGLLSNPQPLVLEGHQARGIASIPTLTIP